jgi:hypothetical protein
VLNRKSIEIIIPEVKKVPAKKAPKKEEKAKKK